MEGGALGLMQRDATRKMSTFVKNNHKKVFCGAHDRVAVSVHRDVTHRCVAESAESEITFFFAVGLERSEECC